MAHNLEDLLDRIEQRDEDAFRVLYEETKKGVYSMIAAVLTDRQTIEDLMQDTYMKMLAKLHTYERGRNFTAWLFQIAKNLAYDHVRKQSMTTLVDPLNSSNLFDRVITEGDPSPDISLPMMLRGLDDVEKEIVLLRSVSETPFKDIARTLGKPLGTVLWLYQRALKKIKKQWEGEK
jgi:RNA polymerase sigma-70 factor (ECF subfamily)